MNTPDVALVTPPDVETASPVDVNTAVPVHAELLNTLKLTVPVGTGDPATPVNVAVSVNVPPNVIGVGETAVTIPGVAGKISVRPFPPPDPATPFDATAVVNATSAVSNGPPAVGLALLLGAITTVAVN